ncbi:MAG: sulfatase-like hydrolase/transferase, partial [Verrucomicrobiae bacterium]|nr:sulfatase-like hydrolase/transferase [Verrucomicrobiae bacterium]
MRIHSSTFFLATIIAGGLWLQSVDWTVAAEKKPNIVYILADDLGYGDLGCFGQKTLATPNLDRMAAEGLKLTRHYAGSTVCAPSRCVLMTGLHTGHSTVRGNGPALLKDEDLTVAEVLKGAGYATGCFGKWGIGNPPPRNDPNRQGFDEFYGYVNMFHAHNFYPPFLVRNGELERLENETKESWLIDGREEGGDKEGAGVAAVKKDYAPDLIANEAVKFIEKQKDGPFFLYFALNIPHANNEGGNDKEQQDGMEVPEYGEFAGKDWPNPEKGFATMIRH